MVRCKNGSLYTGISNNIQERIKKHNNKKGSKAVIALGLPVKLVYKEKVGTYSDALKREVIIKKMSKSKKEKLINGE